MNRARSYHPAQAVSLYSQSCLDAIIHQASQVNRRRNDQCVNAHGLADAAQTNWQHLERKRERKRDREASSLSCAVTPKFACWLHHCAGRVLVRALQAPFLVAVIKPDDLSSSSHLCFADVSLSKRLESVRAPDACSVDEFDL